MAQKTCEQTTEQLRQIITDLLPLAEAGEHYTGGGNEREQARKAAVLAEARKVAGQGER